MSRIVEVKGLKIGEGQPCICVPVVAENIEAIKKQAAKIMLTAADMVEFRADFLTRADDNASVSVALEMLRTKIEEKPILFTFRTSAEGGNKDISTEKYISICKEAIDSGNADLIDIEFFLGKSVVKDLVSYAHRKNVKVVLSNHDFNRTPDSNEITKRLMMMKSAGADIVKIAVMPQNAADVLKLLKATERMQYVKNPVPVITVSMSALGLVSRISGEIFGSAITFASAGTGSAPGQIDADELDRIMNLMHYNLCDSGKVMIGGNTEIKGSCNVNFKGNVILVGFMGTGKSTVAKRISEKTGLKIIEIDDMIEEDAGMSITNIFERYGEKYFRDIETAQVKKIAKISGAVVSCGGGTVMRKENARLLKKSGKIILLRATPETVLERVKRGGDKRPLLNKYQSRGYISWLMKKRRDRYFEVADYIIEVDRRNSEEIAEQIIKYMGISEK